MTAQVTRSDKVLLAEFDGESVLLNTQTGHYFSINEAGLAIWRLASAERSREEIVSELEATFDISHSQASADVDSFLASLKGAELLPR